MLRFGIDLIPTDRRHAVALFSWDRLHAGVLVLVILFLSGCSEPAPEEGRPLDGPWEYALTREPDNLADIRGLAFESLPQPYAALGPLLPDRSTYVVLRTKFDLPPEFLTEPILSFYLGRVNACDRTYLNGRLIGETGRFPPEPTDPWNIPRVYPASRPLLKDAGNELLLVIYPGYASPGLEDVPFIGPRRAMEHLAGLATMQHMTLHMITALFALAAAFIFLLMYLKRRRVVFYLHYSLALVFFFIYSINNFAWGLPFLSDMPFFNALWFQKIDWSALYIFYGFTTLFFRDFLERHSVWPTRFALGFVLVAVLAHCTAMDRESFAAVRVGFLPGIVGFQALHMIWVINARRERVETVSVLLILVVALVSAMTLNDVIVAVFQLPWMFLAPLAIPTMLGGLTLVQIDHFVNAHNEVERLSADQDRLNQEITRQNERLSRLDQLKDQFLANTSHELRTPLNGIIGLADSLIQGAAGELKHEATENLQLIASSGRRLSNLVNDLLDFSRIRHDDLILRRKAVDVHAVIGVVLALSQHIIGDRPIELRHDDEPVPPVDADEDRLEQVLHNLIGNAIKFTKAGAVTVSARVVDAQDDGTAPGFVEISVEDTGIGIPEDRQALVFDSFTQGDGAISREYGGTGLGLSISKQLVELHGGEIRMKSSPGRGTTVYFTLPVSHGEAEAPAWTEVQRRAHLIEDLIDSGTVENDAPVEIPASNGTPYSVLVVDDDSINRRVLRNQLRMLSLQVIEADSGRAALEKVEQHELDVILLDVMMPGLSGYEVCRFIREKSSPSELPIIMLTAKNRVIDIVTGLESGANDYLVKPFDARELSARVANMLELKRAAQTQSHLAAIEGDLEKARQIQQSLIPRSAPIVPGLKVGALYQAMESVGGDYYDFHTDGTLFEVLVADVAGHGIPAALLVSAVHLAFAFERQRQPDPGEFLANLNRAFSGQAGSSFVTACHVKIDTKLRKLWTANAGHPPMFLRRASSKTIEVVRPKGVPLGILPGPRFAVQELDLAPGDRIVLYTDGVTEAAAANFEEFGEERIQEKMLEHANLSAADFTDRLLADVIEWCGGTASIGDDIAIVVIDVE